VFSDWEMRARDDVDQFLNRLGRFQRLIASGLFYFWELEVYIRMVSIEQEPTVLPKQSGEALARPRAVAALAAFVLAFWAAGALAQSEKQTTIQIKIDEKHDRLTPDFEPDIEWLHESTITLSGKNAVGEVGKNTFLGSPLHPATPRLQARLASDFERGAALGQSGGKVVWQVLGPKKLRRIVEGKQTISIYDIDIDGANNCHIAVRYLLQKGFSYLIGKRAGTDTEEHFTLPRLVRASCSIEST